MFTSERAKFFSKMYSEYAENIYNVECNFRLLKIFLGEGKLETFGEIFPSKRCLDKTVV